MEVFTVVCENVSVTAAQDILSAYAATGKKLQLVAVSLYASGQTTIANWPIRLRYLPPTVTPGTGGAAVVPHNFNSVGAAASFTARRNDTTQATSSGTAVTLVAAQFNPLNGYYWQTPTPVGDEAKCESSGAFVLSLDGLTGTLAVSATMWVREN